MQGPENAEHLLDILEKSRLSILTLHLQVTRNKSNQAYLAMNILPMLPKVQDFRVLSSSHELSILRKKPSTQLQPLQILWVPDIQEQVMSNPSRFKHLVSLAVTESLSGFKWREVLSNFSDSLKHLDINFDRLEEEQVEEEDEDAEESEWTSTIEPLSFPNLRFLELGGWSKIFPTWMKVPSNLTISCFQIRSSLPPIQELWVLFMFNWEAINNRCPDLKTLRIITPRHERLHKEEHKKPLVAFLKERNQSVADGIEFEGRKIQKVERLEISLEGVEKGMLKKFNDAVDELVDLREVYSLFELEV